MKSFSPLPTLLQMELKILLIKGQTSAKISRDTHRAITGSPFVTKHPSSLFPPCQAQSYLKTLTNSTVCRSYSNLYFLAVSSYKENHQHGLWVLPSAIGKHWPPNAQGAAESHPQLGQGGPSSEPMSLLCANATPCQCTQPRWLQTAVVMNSQLSQEKSKRCFAKPTATAEQMANSLGKDQDRITHF